MSEKHHDDTSALPVTGTTREGRRVVVRGCDFYSFRDGRVTRKDSYWKIVEGA